MTAQLLVLLPPSETKSDGGNRHSPAPFRWPELDPIRTATRDDLIELCYGDPAHAAAALKISARLADLELARNRALVDPALLPASERYTGVLYDALDIRSFEPDARAWFATHVAIHSALYGLVGADDEIAAYRLSHDSRLPDPSLKQRWRAAISAALAAHRGPMLDLRSKGYVGLGPVGERDNYAHLEFSERLPDGSTRALNHFNKRTKGLLVRTLAHRLAGRAELRDVDGVFAELESFAEVERTGDSSARIIRPTEYPQPGD